MLARRASVFAIVVAMFMATIGLSAPAGAAAAPKVTISAGWMVQAGIATPLKGSVSEGSGHTFYLQWRVSITNDSWSTIKTGKVAANGAKGLISTSFVPRSGEHVYRVVIKKDALRVVSNSLTIRTTTGSVYLAKARYYMKKYCPLTPLAATLPRGGYLAGQANLSYRWQGTYDSSGRLKMSYSWTQSINFRPGLADDALRAVSWHECAHVVQHRQVVKGEAFYNKQEQAVDTLYKGNGIEKQADCMTAYLLKTTQWLTYTTSCSPAQTEAGRRLWADYGSRYQAPNYRWVLYQG